MTKHLLAAVLGAAAFLAATGLAIVSTMPGGALDRWLTERLDRALTLPEPTKDPR